MKQTKTFFQYTWDFQGAWKSFENAFLRQMVNIEG